MKKRSKIISLLLAASMALGMTACGGGGGNGISKEEAKQGVYHMEDKETELFGDGGSNNLTYVDGRLYTFRDERFWAEEIGTRISLASVDKDGKDLQLTELFSNVHANPDWNNNTWGGEDGGDVDIDGGGIDVMPMPRDGVAESQEDAPVEEPVATDETVTAPDGSQVNSDTWMAANTISASGAYLILESNSYYYDNTGNYNALSYTLDLYAYDLNGNLRYKQVLSENQNENYVYYNSILADDKGRLILVADNGITVLDENGNPLAEAEGVEGNGWMSAVLFGKNDMINMVYSEYSQDGMSGKMVLKQFNLKTNKYEADAEIPQYLNNYQIKQGINSDFLLLNSMGAYTYNIGDAEPKLLMNFINSDIPSNNIQALVQMEDGTLLMAYNDWETYDLRLASLTPVAPEDVPDKEIILIASNWLDYNMRTRILDFNKTSDKYRIMLKDYSAYNTMDNYSAGVEQLNNDILAGKMPDILIIDDYNMPVDSYIAKGLLADIRKLIEDDEELNIDDYMTNVFDAYSVNGKLYSIIPSFSVQTVVGKTSLVGKEPGWTLADLKALMAKYPDASVFGDSMTRDSLLWNLIAFGGSRFVDKTTGKCNFNTDEFISLLEFANEFPAEYVWDDTVDWSARDNQYRDNKVLLMQMYLYRLRDLARVEQGQFGEDISFIGFPSENGNGAVLRADSQYAISAKSKCKEGAWEFLKYYLTPEYQMEDNNTQYTIPVLKEAVEKQLKEAQEKPYWKYPDGTVEYYDDTYWIGDQQITINPLTKEEADELYDYVSSITEAQHFDQDLFNIINEEAAPFFEGQKSAKEVAEIIQSRASIYISEGR